MSALPDSSQSGHAGPPRRRAAVTFIFITAVLDVLALGIVVPVLPKLVTDFLHGNTAHTAQIYGIYGTVWALMQFIFAPVLGSLSDRFGRRPVVLISNFGLGLDYVLMALSPNLWWLLVGRIISGITAATFPVAGAYIADVSPPEKRAQGFGLLGAAFGIGFVLGPALGGWLGDHNPRLPFWVAAGFSLANALYGFFVLPESLPPERRAPFAWKRANPFGAFVLLRSHRELLGLSGVMFLLYLAHEVLPNVFVLYAIYRYQWSMSTCGLTLASVGVCSAVVQSTLIRPLVAFLGDRRAVLAGFVFGVTGMATFGLAKTGVLFWVGVPVMALWGLSAPTLQSLMSRRVGPSEQGRLQGANSSLRGVTGMIGPGLFTLTFAAFITGGSAAKHGWQVPGAPFLLAAFLLVAAFLAAAVITRGMGKQAGLPEVVPDATDNPAADVLSH